MKNIILSVVCIFFIQSITLAQYTLGAHYVSPSFSNWNKALTFKQGDPRYIYSNGFEVDAGYWFGLDKVRVEFNPKLAYSRFSQKVKGENILSSKESEKFLTNRVRFSILTSIYFLDIKNACDCPTINKQGNIFKKGLFVFLEPVVNYNFNSYTYKSVNSGEDKNFSYDGLSYGGKIGMGFDIGVSKLMTFTPMFSYGFYINNKWEGLSQAIYTDNNEIIGGDLPNTDLDISNQGAFSIGFRLLFRLDQFYKYTRRAYK